MVRLMPLLHIEIKMLFLLLFVTSASSQSLTTPTASGLQAFVETYPHPGTVVAGGEVLFPITLSNPGVPWFSVILTVISGEVDLLVYLRSGPDLISWYSAVAGNDRVDILETDPQLLGDGKRLLRRWDAAVIGYQTSQFN
jgi:hypothetical protein